MGNVIAANQLGGREVPGDSLGMEADTWWFMWQAVVSGVALLGGLRIGRGPRRRATIASVLAFMLMGVWLWLQRHPAVAVHAFPVQLFSYFEGTGAVPFFMFNMGIAWRCSAGSRQRRVVALAVCLGAVYFVNGGIWMLQATPRSLLANDSDGDVTMQSSDFSCVAAACATVLNKLAEPDASGIPSLRTTESEMAILTRTRPGFGATIVRALEGLNYKLEPTPMRAVLLEVSYEQLQALAMPAVTPLQLGMTRHHMVVLREVNADHVEMFDPQNGDVTMMREDFEATFSHQVIAFER